MKLFSLLLFSPVLISSCHPKSTVIANILSPPAIVDITIGEGHAVYHLKDSDCDKSEVGYFFLGPDQMVGIATDSCENAFKDWTKTAGQTKTNII